MTDFSAYQGLHWVIAFSGGADSRLLLQLASENRQLALSIKAVYVHHHLQDEADTWAKFCKNEAEKLGVECFIEHVDVSEKGSIEANAREARYLALSRYIQENSVLFTAHHADDLFETLLFGIIRGSGLNGLTSMPSQRPFFRGILARPLLRMSRFDIEKACNERGIEFVIDPSNNDIFYDRNYLRIEVIPRIKRRFPQILSSVNKVQEHLTCEKNALYEFLEQELDKVIVKSKFIDGLNYDELIKRSDCVKQELLRYYFKKEHNCILNTKEIQDIFALGSLSSDNKALVDVGVNIAYYRGMIYTLPKFLNIPDFIELKVGLPLLFSWGYYVLEKINPQSQELCSLESDPLAKYVSEDICDYDLLYKKGYRLFNFLYENKKDLELLPCYYLLADDDKLSLKFKPLTSVRFKPISRLHSQLLKALWKEYKVPLYLRDFAPQVLVNGVSAGIYGVFKENYLDTLKEQSKPKSLYRLTCNVFRN